MLHQTKSRRELIASFMSIAVVVLSLLVIGCNSESGTDDQGIVVRNPQRTTPTVSPSPVSDTATIPETAEPEEVVVVAPEPPREVTYEDAEAAFDERRYEDATELFKRYTDRKSENPWGFYMLGLSAWKTGDNETAQRSFERTLQLDPQHVKSFLNLGRVLLDVERPEEALVKIRQALQVDPQSSVAYRLKGRVFHQIRQKHQAVDAYRRAIQIDNEDAWSMNNIGLIFIEEKLFDAALPPLARAVELQTDNATFLNNLGMALESTGRFRAAEEAYRSAVSADESYTRAVDNLARITIVLEDPGLEPLDLGIIAQRFVEEIESWDVVVDGDETEAHESDPDETVSTVRPQTPVVAKEVSESVDTDANDNSVVDSDSTETAQEE